MNFNDWQPRDKSYLPHVIIGTFLFFVACFRAFGFWTTVVGTCIAYVLSAAVVLVAFGVPGAQLFFYVTLILPLILLDWAVSKYVDLFPYITELTVWLDKLIGATS